LVDYVEDEGVVFLPVEDSTPIEIDEEVSA